MQIKTTVKYQLIPVRMPNIKITKDTKCWQGCMCTVYTCVLWEGIYWQSHYGKQYGGSSKN